MRINILGKGDTRPVLYTLMKLFQSFGDVLLLTNNARLLRLSDTGVSEGHYQNVMIAYTDEGLDDFWATFSYNPKDFETIIIDGIDDPNADLYFFCKSMIPSEDELDQLSYLESRKTIEISLFSDKNRYFDARALYNIEEFECLQNMCLISYSLAEALSKALAKHLRMGQRDIMKVFTMKNFVSHTRKNPLSWIKRG